ncbi:MAG: helix-turn-helix transcriptional regulator [Ruminococcaceae bacterium]|nr:helix-turn-helix transcriptional regulator [Oscillospiraceae bacterium]
MRMRSIYDLTVINIQDVITVYSEKGDHTVIRNRSSYGLSFGQSGRIEYEHNGCHFLSEPGVALLHPQGATYRLYRRESGEFPLINFYLYGDELPQEFVVFRLRDPAWYLREVEELKDLCLLPHNRLRVIGRLYGMLYRLYTEGHEQKSTISPLLDYIAAHYGDSSLGNDRLAGQVGISEVYMRQLFRREIGMSPKQYIQHLRIQKAKQLLEEGHASVTEIAQRCGFSAIYPFCRAFKTATGETPTDYRRHSRYYLL